MEVSTTIEVKQCVGKLTLTATIQGRAPNYIMILDRTGDNITVPLEEARELSEALADVLAEVQKLTPEKTS